MMSKKNQSRNSWGKIPSILGVLAGIGILIALVWWTGFSKFIKAIDQVGPAILLLTLFYPFILVSRGYGWRWVYPENTENKNLPTRVFILGFWFAQSINILVPTATIGGAIARGRYLSKKGGEQTDVITSLIVDKTVHAIATVVILILGLLLILTKSINDKFLYIIISICVALSVGIYFFIRLQRSSRVSKLLERWAGSGEGVFSTSLGRADIIEKKLEEIYKHPHILIFSVIIRVLGDIAMAGEVWLAARLLNTPVSIPEAITLRLVSFGVRSAAFFIWGGLGVQESMYALLSTVTGLSPPALIVISLATRAQEIITSILGVCFWLSEEGYRAFHTTGSGSEEKLCSTHKKNEQEARQD